MTRLAIGVVSILLLLLFTPHLPLYFSGEGLFTSATIRHQHDGPVFSLLFFNDSPLCVIVLFALLLGALIALCLNFFPRVSAFVSFLLFASFFNRLPLLDFGGSMMLTVCLFFLSMVPNPSPGESTANGFGIRAIQLTLAIVYFMCGTAKIASPDWLQGEAMTAVLTGEQAVLSMPWIVNFPVVSALLTWVTICAEISFVYLIWIPATRRVVILTLFMMHLGIFFLLHVSVMFTEAFMAMLIAFVTEEDWRLLRCWFQRPKSKISSSL